MAVTGAEKFLFGDADAGINNATSALNAGYGNAMNTMNEGFGRSQDILAQGRADNNTVNRMGTARSRLDMARQFTQDANKYEQDRATQGALAAYGDDPLGSGARSSMTAQLAQLARQNYGAGLDRANAATNNNMGIASGQNQTFMNAGLGENSGYTTGMSNLQTGLANSVAGLEAQKANDGGIVGRISTAASRIGF